MHTTYDFPAGKNTSVKLALIISFLIVGAWYCEKVIGYLECEAVGYTNS